MKMDELLDEIYQKEADLLKIEEEEQEIEETLLRQENIVLQRIRKEQSERMEQKQGVKQNYIVQFPAKKKNGKRIKRKKIAVILVAAVMMFGSVVSASQYYDLDIRLEKMIGSGEVMKDLPGGFVQVGVSDTDKKVTLEATQTIGDKNSQWIVLDTNIPWKAGKDGYYMFENMNLLFYKNSQKPEPGGYSVESYNNNGFVSFFVSAEVKDINRLSVCIECSSILEYDSLEDDAKDGRVVSDGNWKLEWKNRYTGNANITYPMEMVEIFSENGTSFSALVYKIEHSPLNIRVEMIKNPTTKSSTQMELIEIASVTLKDGTIVPANVSQSGSSNNTFLHTSISFESMGKINLEEVKSIRIGGEEIELK